MIVRRCALCDAIVSTDLDGFVAHKCRPIAPRKDDRGKPDMTLLPWESLLQAARVLTWACTEKKPVPYGRDSWRHIDGALNRYMAALERHIAAFHMGERIDEDSGLPTMAHIACDALIVCALWLAEDKKP